MNDRTRRGLAVGLIVSGILWGVVLVPPSGDDVAGVHMASGASMGETFPEIVVYADTEIDRGDEVLFRNRGEWIHHRAIERAETGGWVTQGDAMESPDQRALDEGRWIQPANEENTAGVVVVAVGLHELGIGAVVAALLLAALDRAARSLRVRGAT